jgi:hypothetical protein
MPRLSNTAAYRSSKFNARQCRGAGTFSRQEMGGTQRSRSFETAEVGVFDDYLGAGADKKENKDQQKEGEPDASPAASPTPSDEGSPSPSPGLGEGPEGSPSPTPGSSPKKQPTGKVEAASEEKPKEQQDAQAVEPEPEKDGQMSEKQAQALLRPMKEEEQRVQLDERKTVRRVYKDW